MDNIKRHNLHITRVPEEKRRTRQGWGGVSLFKYRMAANFPKWGRF